MPSPSDAERDPEWTCAKGHTFRYSDGHGCPTCLQEARDRADKLAAEVERISQEYGEYMELAHAELESQERREITVGFAAGVLVRDAETHAPDSPWHHRAHWARLAVDECWDVLVAKREDTKNNLDWVKRVEQRAASADQAERELREARDWINDLQSGMYINCVYCGHRYGPSDEHAATSVDDGATPSMQEALRAHIAQCPQHPLSAALQTRDALAKALRPFEATHGYDSSGFCPDCMQQWPCNVELARRALALVPKHEERSDG